MKANRPLDVSVLKNRSTRTISTEQALADVIPVNWPEEVLNGQKKVTISNATPDGDKICVKLETL